MQSELLMGIDIGTQSTRAALLTLDGRAVAMAGRSQEMQTPRINWAEQDPEMWWRHTIECIKEVMAAADIAADAILGVGVGGQMHGAVPLGADGQLLSHSVQLWCDKRGADLVDEYSHTAAAQDAFLQQATRPLPTGSASSSNGSASTTPTCMPVPGNLSFPRITSTTD